MENSLETPPAPSAAVNDRLEISKRVVAGRIPWAGPLLLIVGRSVFLVAAQALVALLFLLRHDPSPWGSAGQWWTVYGNLADVGCLALLWKYTRAEGVSLRSLLGPSRWRYGFDIWFGLGLCVLIFPLLVVGGMIANWLVFGTFIASTAPAAGAAAAAPHVFPLWRTIYSVSVWWIIWTPTEQLTYQGFALPRLQALTRRTWVAFVLVGFFWSLQHSFLPFVPQWRYVVLRFVMVVPGLVVTMLIYLRTRRLVPMIIAQWPMDILVAFMTTTSLLSR
ncbi:MAG: CPBP family glutamic-type intramembrane protease [Terracidiphilus sp.]